MTNPYPEKLPSQGFESFLFSYSTMKTAEQNLQNEYDTINKRILNIVDSEKFFVNDFPVLKNLMALNPSREELKKLAKAIDRLGDLVEIYKELSAKVELIKTMRDNQTWFTNTFADFDKEIDRDLQDFINSTIN